LSICKIIDLQLKETSLCKPMLIGARVAPLSSVGCSKGREYQESNYIQEREEKYRTSCRSTYQNRVSNYTVQNRRFTSTLTNLSTNREEEIKQGCHYPPPHHETPPPQKKKKQKKTKTKTKERWGVH
jgi:hypothetical protein